MYGNIEQVEVLLSQFEWKSRESRDSPTETRLTDRCRSLSFVTAANFPRAVTVRRMANDVTCTMYAALPIHYVYMNSRTQCYAILYIAVCGVLPNTHSCTMFLYTI